jgi:hypothetical protein
MVMRILFKLKFGNTTDLEVDLMPMYTAPSLAISISLKDSLQKYILIGWTSLWCNRATINMGLDKGISIMRSILPCYQNYLNSHLWVPR